MLEESRVVHIRGTPASGKTTLAHLLKEYYQQQEVPSVVISTWSQCDDCKYTKLLVEQANEEGYTFVTRQNLRDCDIVFILDEAQVTYDDPGLWVGLIKTQIGALAGPRICLLSSYGSPSEGTSGFPETPLGFLDATKRVSITVSMIEGSPPISLFYNRGEFDDVVDRICADVRQQLPLSAEARDYIFTLTNGHPGAVEAVLLMLKKVGHPIQYSLHAPIADVPHCRCTAPKSSTEISRRWRRIMSLSH